MATRTDWTRGTRLAVPVLAILAYFGLMWAVLEAFSRSDRIWSMIVWLEPTSQADLLKTQETFPWLYGAKDLTALCPDQVARISTARVRSGLACFFFLALSGLTILSNLFRINRCYLGPPWQSRSRMAGVSVGIVLLLTLPLFLAARAHGHSWIESFVKILDSKALVPGAGDAFDLSDVIDITNAAGALGLASFLVLATAMSPRPNMKEGTEECLRQRARYLDAILWWGGPWLVALIWQVAAYYQLAATVGEIVYDYGPAGETIMRAIVFTMGTGVSGGLAVIWGSVYWLHVTDVNEAARELRPKNKQEWEAALGIQNANRLNLLRIAAIVAPSIAAYVVKYVLEA